MCNHNLKLQVVFLKSVIHILLPKYYLSVKLGNNNFVFGYSIKCLTGSGNEEDSDESDEDESDTESSEETSNSESEEERVCTVLLSQIFKRDHNYVMYLEP